VVTVLIPVSSLQPGVDPLDSVDPVDPVDPVAPITALAPPPQLPA
jgi:hypothetical protein